MAGNRVEELETKVRELQATVSGLTDELVETKERLRLIEDEVDRTVDDLVEGKASRQQARQDLPGGQASQETTAADETSAPERATDEATDGGRSSAEKAKSEETEGEEETSESGDDIIVA